MSSSIESLISNHELIISQLYTKLSPNPQELLNSSLKELENSLSKTILIQLSSIESQVIEAESLLESSWKKVSDWKIALGETNLGRERSSGPLINLIIEVESILESMRSRMEERGLLIVNLQSRLINMREILGIEWMQVELENIENGWEGLDLRLERLSKLEREVVRGDSEINHRRNTINVNTNEIFAIRTELGIHQDITQASTSTCTSSSSSSYRQSIGSPNVPTSDPFDEAILCHLGIGEHRIKKELIPTSENLLRIEAKRKWLEEEKDHRNALIQSTYDKLYPLWTMLGVSDLEMEDFVNKYMGSTADVVLAYQSELTRMLTLKRSNLSSFILLERTHLSTLWDKLYLSPPQRLASFPPFTINVTPTKFWNAINGVEEELVNENVSEELLVAHERERARLEEEVEGVKGILDRLERYFSVVEEMRELEASAADPSRLLGKATRGDPGRLLREEKARKRIIKDKPKLEAELRSIIPTWELKNSRPFLVNGKRFLDDLNQKEEAEALEKENKKRAKLGLSATSSTSSSTSSSRTVPLRPQPTGTSSSHSSASSIHPPIKRQMTGIKGGAPLAKRQVAMPTGSTSGSSRTVLGENSNTIQVQGKLTAQITGRSAFGGGGGLSNSGSRGINKSTINSSSTSSNQSTNGTTSGMKIPSGWGGGEDTGLDPNLSSSRNLPSTTTTAGFILPQATGGFRPRGSNMSSSSSLAGR